MPPLNQRLRHAPIFMRSTASLVLIAFLSLTLQPLAIAANLPTTAAAPQKETSTEEKLEKTLEDLEHKLEKLEDKLDKRQSAAAEEAEVERLRRTIEDLDLEAIKDFEIVEADLKRKNIPSVILERHTAAVMSYQDNMRALRAQLAQVIDAKDDQARKTEAAKIGKHLKEKLKGRVHTPLNPHKLPFRIPEGKARKPKETAQELRAELFPHDYKVASLAFDPNYLSAVAYSLPTDADLAPTEDVQITDEIKTLATQLEHNPVKIYNWVHNNIRFIPTYGSIQGSQLTLDNKQGNAFDVASLLIALLRASGIHARYVYGTVQMPIDKVMNWVGGVTTADAAQELLGQGGIPNAALVKDGRATDIRLEHIWVEAYVDFHPSRGAIHKKGDSWVPMDGGFKQYSYTSGLNVKAVAPFDSAALITSALQGATVNTQEGWVQNINHENITFSAENYQRVVYETIKTENPNATFDEIVGSAKVNGRSSSILAASLPYRVLAVGSKSAELPATLRYYVQVSQYQSNLDQAMGSPSLSYKTSFPALNSKRLGVTYEPASVADKQTIDGYVQSGATSIPAYLINVRPAIQVDGVTVSTGYATTMGTKQIWEITVTDPLGLRTGSELFDYTVAGDELVFGINGNGITPSIPDLRFQKVPSDTASENLFTVSLYYWMLHDLQDKILASKFGVVTYRLPSVGLFATPMHVRYFFGIPRTGYYMGRQMDVKRLHLAAAGDDQKAVTPFVKHAGFLGSYLEGTTFDMLFNQGRGMSVSAVRLLQEANENGIPLHHITQQNLQSVLPRLTIDAEAKAEIVAAVSAGKEAIVSEREVVRAQWSGTGYVLQDPLTGSGAYLIKGGLNGGAQDPCPPPAAQPVSQPLAKVVANLLWAILFIAVLGAIIVGSGGTTAPAMIVLFLAIIGLGAMPSPASAAPLLPGPQALWDSMFSAKYGPYRPGPVYPGEGLKSPGLCSDSQHSSLMRVQRTACAKKGGGTCSRTKNCAEKQEYFQNEQACIDARLDVMSTCFAGGDEAHWNEVKNRLHGLHRCFCSMGPGGCAP